MKVTFETTHKQVANKLDIRVDVTAEEIELKRVITKVDSDVLAVDNLGKGSSSYSRTFHDAISFSPGVTHTLIVTADLPEGQSKVHTEIWVD